MREEGRARLRSLDARKMTSMPRRVDVSFAAQRAAVERVVAMVARELDVEEGSPQYEMLSTHVAIMQVVFSDESKLLECVRRSARIALLSPEQRTGSADRLRPARD
jgi:hypothetical protein